MLARVRDRAVVIILVFLLCGVLVLSAAGYGGLETVRDGGERPVAAWAPGDIYLPLIANGCNESEIASEFQADACGWITYSGTWTLDGETYATLGGQKVWATIGYNAIFGNFDYRARLMREGCAYCATNLIVRGTPDPLRGDSQWDTFYIFQFSRERQFSVWRSGPQGFILPLQAWTPSDAINGGNTWNELRVVAIGGFFFFFINDTLVWGGIDQAFAAGQVGIGMFRDDVSTGDRLAVDWARLSRFGGAAAMEAAGVAGFELPADLATVSGDAAGCGVWSSRCEGE